MEELAARFVDPLVGVGAEVIPLGLEEVGGKLRAPVAVEKRESGAEAGKRDSHEGPFGDNFAPGS